MTYGRRMTYDRWGYDWKMYCLQTEINLTEDIFNTTIIILKFELDHLVYFLFLWDFLLLGFISFIRIKFLFVYSTIMRFFKNNFSKFRILNHVSYVCNLDGSSAPYYLLISANCLALNPRSKSRIIWYINKSSNPIFSSEQII